MKGVLGRLVDIVVSAGALVGGVALWAITLMVAYDVVVRYFGHPTIWSLEISTYLLLAVALAGAGDALRHDAHFAVDIVPRALSGPIRRRLDMVLTVVTILFAAYFAWGVWQLLEMTSMLGMVSPTVLKIPLVYPQSMLMVGAITLVLAGLRRLLARSTPERVIDGGP